MKKTLRLMLPVALLAYGMLTWACSPNKKAAANNEATTEEVADSVGTVDALGAAEFTAQVGDYKGYPDAWKPVAKLPTVVDFYADWCGPCRMIAPIWKELAHEYKGKIRVYKVNVDDEPELANAFKISGIPALLFVPTEGKPEMVVGGFPKEAYVQLVDSLLLGK